MSALQIQLNGQRYPLDTPCSLLALVQKQPVELKNVAVELNRQIIPRAKLEQVQLIDGDAVEIVEFIGGG